MIVETKIDLDMKQIADTSFVFSAAFTVHAMIPKYKNTFNIK